MCTHPLMVHIPLFSISSIEVFDIPFVSGLNVMLNKALIIWYGQVAETSGLGNPRRKMRSVSGLVPPSRGYKDQKKSLMAARVNPYLERY